MLGFARLAALAAGSDGQALCIAFISMGSLRGRDGYPPILLQHDLLSQAKGPLSGDLAGLWHLCIMEGALAPDSLYLQTAQASFLACMSAVQKTAKALLLLLMLCLQVQVTQWSLCPPRWSQTSIAWMLLGPPAAAPAAAQASLSLGRGLTVAVRTAGWLLLQGRQA